MPIRTKFAAPLQGELKSVGMRWYRKQRWAIRSRWAKHRSYLIANRLHSDRAPVDHDTVLAIEGFPRSANTFATVAFQVSQPEPVRLAHHLHAPSQIIASVRAGVPAVVLVRHPRDAAMSLVIRAPHITMELALTGYTRFYAPLVPFSAGYFVARFEDVVADFGQVVCAVNDRFGTEHVPFSHTPERVAEVYRLIDEQSAHVPWERALKEYVSGRISRAELEEVRSHGREPLAITQTRVARPSEERQMRHAALLRHYNDPALRAARRRAEALYRQFCGGEA
jgi:hypothetical protein